MDGYPDGSDVVSIRPSRTGLVSARRKRGFRFAGGYAWSPWIDGLRRVWTARPERMVFDSFDSLDSALDALIHNGWCSTKLCLTVPMHSLAALACTVRGET